MDCASVIPYPLRAYPCVPNSFFLYRTRTFLTKKKLLDDQPQVFLLGGHVSELRLRDSIAQTLRADSFTLQFYRVPFVWARGHGASPTREETGGTSQIG